MKHIIEEWSEEIYSTALWDFYFDGMRVGSLDIETTGFNSTRNKFILGGVYNVETHRLHQILAESRAEEPAALQEYMDTISDLDVLITYNGKSFDIPFLNGRLAAYPAVSPGSCDHLYNLDLYQVLSSHSPIRKLVPNLRQKTVENYMGLWETRADEISGAESVDLYNQFEATGDPDAEAQILLHNNDDVRQLTRLTKAIIKSDFHEAMFCSGFPVKCGERMLTVNQIRLSRSSLDCSGVLNRLPVNYIGFDWNGWPVASDFRGDGFRISVPIIRQQGVTVVDLEASGLPETDFADYPGCASGFLVIEDKDGIQYRETNHFIKQFIVKFMEECL